MEPNEGGERADRSAPRPRTGVRAAAGATSRWRHAARLVVAAVLLLTVVAARIEPAVAAPRYDIDHVLGLGGAATDVGRAIGYDSAGNQYLAGTFTGPVTFPTTPPTALAGYQSGGATLFVAKQSPTGQLLWVQQLGGTTGADIGGMTVDGAGLVHVAGSYAGTGTFGSGSATKTLTSAGGTDGFLARFDTNGTLVWVTGFGGTGNDAATALTMRGQYPVVAGTFNGTANFGEGAQLKTLTTSSPDQLFLAFFGGLGKLQWVVAGTSPAATVPRGLASDGYGQMFVTGSYRTSLTLAGSPSLSVTAVGDSDVFVAGFNASGTIKWLKTNGGPGTDDAAGIAVDPSGAWASITGFYSGTTTFGLGGNTATLTSTAPRTAFVARYQAGVGQFTWARTPTGSGTSAGTSVALDPAGNPLVSGLLVGAITLAGTTPSTPVPLSVAPFSGWVAAFDGTGAATWGRVQTGNQPTSTMAVASTPNGAIGATGAFNGTVNLSGDFDNQTLTGANDAFAVRFKAHANRAPTTTPPTVTAVSALPKAIVLTGADPDGDPLTYAVTTPPAHGTLTGTAPNLSYTSAGGFTGPDTFTYSVADGLGGSTSATATVMVTPADTRPTANNATVATIPGRATPITATGSDPSGGTLTFALDGPAPTHGTVTGTGPTFTYTSTAGYLGPDSFGFEVTNSSGNSATATITVNVKKPNIVMVMTDDQTLGQQSFLPKTNALLGGQGATFSNYAVSYSECCPSRATLLSGQYSHNNGMLSSMLPTGGASKFDASNSLATWLQAAGYYTSLGGKYFNGYGTDLAPTVVPPGWSDWFGFYDPNTYEMFEYDVNVNGTLTHFGSNPADYSTDVLGAHAQQVIRSQAGTATPFFVYVAPPTPHNVNQGLTTRAAPKYQNTLTGTQAPRTPAFNQPNVSGMPPWISSLPTMSDPTIAGIDNIYRVGAEALLSIDDMVEGLYNTLRDTGELDNTIFVYTSDNGFHYGDHRIALGKSDQYEETVHLPLLVRGPGYPAGSTVRQPTANIDLAPTFVAAAGATAGRTMDGVPLTNFVNSASYGTQRTVLIENGPLAGRRTYQGIRDNRWKYVVSSTGVGETYDLQNDPYELANVNAAQASTLVGYSNATRLTKLKSCSGQTCHVGIP